MAPYRISPVQDVLGLPSSALPGLRDQLFDLTRRNRMLYFRPTRGALDLSAATGTPCSEDAPTIRRLVRRNGIRLDLEASLGTLKSVAAQARRDEAEYGANSLYLITSFLLRPDPEQPIRSPLLLVPVRLRREGNVFHLSADADEAVVNPVLRYELERRHDLQLPETVPLQRLHHPIEALAGFTRETTSLTLTTLAYRSSGLLRDYRALIDETFGASTHSEVRPHAEEHLVLPADDSQLEVIRAAGAGESFVVQGPPGTGKSQTIANLIADAVANGRRVLFVCTKRAALDVVHARLREVGLADLSCLIHDARQDRPAFVYGLRDSYHAWKESPEDASDLRKQLERRKAGQAAAEQVLNRYAELLDGPVEPNGPTLGRVLAGLVELPPETAELDVETPGLAAWVEAMPVLRALDRVLDGAAPDRTPARFLTPSGLQDPKGIRSWAYRAQELLRERNAAEKQYRTAALRAEGWDTEITDVQQMVVLHDAARRSGNPLRFLMPNWYRARSLVRRDYRAPVEDAELSMADAIGRLLAETHGRDALRGIEERLSRHLGMVPEQWSLDDLEPAIAALTENPPPSPKLLRTLNRLHQHPALLPWLRHSRLSVRQTEHALLRAAMAGVEADLSSTDTLLTQASVLAESRAPTARITARFVKAAARNAFRDRDAWSRRRSDEDPERPAWAEGRRILLREFRKVRAHRPIRELAEGSTGMLVEKLRPVWLMSPEAVSDTLPLTAGLFDLVIIDEASQMPVAEAVPVVHRGRQLIVVGDRMQLPPTRFFESGPATESVLELASRTLPTRMLTWHYRSRSEDLVAFGNEHFYQGRLRMAPQPRALNARREPIVVEIGDPREPMVAAEQVRAGVDALLDRALSLHSTPGAHYRQQANRGEARYVAELVRELLRRETGLTIGVVTFSLAQRAAVDRALDELEATDPEFAARYAAEQDRQDQEQAVGLFVKNLENVQGDERDVMIISVGYGPGLTAFGPLSTEGGERRLNVVTSRARSHLAVVTSLGPDSIAESENRGTELLRRYLAYVAAVSMGDVASAPTPVVSSRTSTIGKQLSDRLRAGGLEVSDGFAAGMFRIDLAVSSAEQPGVWVAVLIESVEGGAPLEPLTAQAMLGRAGWRVVPVLLRDWYQDPEQVLLRITAWFSRVP